MEYQIKGETKLALEECKKAVELLPDDDYANMTCGEIICLIGNITEVISYIYRKAIGSKPYFANPQYYFS